MSSEISQTIMYDTINKEMVPDILQTSKRRQHLDNGSLRSGPVVCSLSDYLNLTSDEGNKLGSIYTPPFSPDCIRKQGLALSLD